MEYTFISKNEQETKKLAAKLALLLPLGTTLLLKGDLGAGKTTFTKGLAEGLNITEKVNSPTFNILKIYLKGDKPLFHIDAYRLEGNDDDIGLDEFIDGPGLCVIEWPTYIQNLLPAETLDITITHRGLTTRDIKLSTNKPGINDILKEVLNDD